DPGLGDVRLAARGGTAAGSNLAPQAWGRDGPLFHPGDARHARAGLRPPSPVVPDRAGLQLQHRRRHGADGAGTHDGVIRRFSRGACTARDRAVQAPRLNQYPATMDKARIPVKLHRRVCLLQTEDAILTEELLASKKLVQDVVGRLADRVLLIRPGRVDAVV